jgi:hypothetical protein
MDLYLSSHQEGKNPFRASDHAFRITRAEIADEHFLFLGKRMNRFVRASFPAFSAADTFIQVDENCAGCFVQAQSIDLWRAGGDTVSIDALEAYFWIGGQGAFLFTDPDAGFGCIDDTEMFEAAP